MPVHTVWTFVYTSGILPRQIDFFKRFGPIFLEESTFFDIFVEHTKNKHSTLSVISKNYGET
jgi:hypothetical protein